METFIDQPANENSGGDLREFREVIARKDEFEARGWMVLEGRHLFDRLLYAGRSPLAVLCVPALDAEMRRLAGGRWPVFSLPEPEIGSLAGFPFHRGVLTLAIRPEIPDFSKGWTPPGDGLVLALPRITDEANLGAILRSAAAFGAATVLLGRGCADPFSRKSLRAGMGAALRLAMYRADPESLKVLRRSGFAVAAAHRSEGSLSLDAFEPAPRQVLVFGHESEGVPTDWLSPCDLSVWIPMEEGTDSLNVAVSAGILLWKARKRTDRVVEKSLEGAIDSV